MTNRCYLTTAIPYVNGAPHYGAYDLLAGLNLAEALQSSGDTDRRPLPAMPALEKVSRLSPAAFAIRPTRYLCASSPFKNRA